MLLATAVCLSRAERRDARSASRIAEVSAREAISRSTSAASSSPCALARRVHQTIVVRFCIRSLMKSNLS